MPSSPPTVCRCGGRRVGGVCDRCGPKKASKPSKNRDSKLYGRRWHEASLMHRQQNPLCVKCEEEGIIKAAHCVDHIVPHKGNLDLFWDRSNWQSLCERHHNQKSAKE